MRMAAFLFFYPENYFPNSLGHTFARLVSVYNSALFKTLRLCHPVIIPEKGGKFHFHAPIGALVSYRRRLHGTEPRHNAPTRQNDRKTRDWLYTGRQLIELGF